MTNLSLNFLNTDKSQKGAYAIIALLEKYGKEIENYAIEYIHTLVTQISQEGRLLGASLYIILPEIKYDYKILTLDFIDTEKVRISFFPIEMSQSKSETVNYLPEMSKAAHIIRDMLGSESSNASLKFLINQVHFKRERKKMELRFNLSDEEIIKKLWLITFDKNNAGIISTKQDVSDRIESILKIDKSNNVGIADFSNFTNDIIFLYAYKNEGLLILFCDKTSIQPYCIWETPENYPEDAIGDYSQKFINYYLSRQYSSSPFFDFFKIIQQAKKYK